MGPGTTQTEAEQYAVWSAYLNHQAIPEGAERFALVASAPSPSAQHDPPPAIVVMIPVVETLRIAFPSAMYMFPAESKVNPSGVRKAEVACPPSPFPVDGFPPPATVLIVKLCPTQTPRNKIRPQAVFVIGIRHSTICGKIAENHYREECFSSLLFARPHVFFNFASCSIRLCTDWLAWLARSCWKSAAYSLSCSPGSIRRLDSSRCSPSRNTNAGSTSDSGAGPEAIGFQVVLKAIMGSVREALRAGR